MLADALFDILNSDAAQQSYVIINALDKCPINSRERFFGLIINRVEKHDADHRAYNFLFTSRKEADIKARMQDSTAAIHNLPIPADYINANVHLHVKQFIASNRGIKDFPAQLKAEIKDTISEKAQGM